MYYYRIEFNDGRIVRREGVTKWLALAVFHAMNYEMVLFDVHGVEWGKL